MRRLIFFLIILVITLPLWSSWLPASAFRQTIKTAEDNTMRNVSVILFQLSTTPNLPTTLRDGASDTLQWVLNQRNSHERQVIMGYIKLAMTDMN